MLVGHLLVLALMYTRTDSRFVIRQELTAISLLEDKASEE